MAEKKKPSRSKREHLRSRMPDHIRDAIVAAAKKQGLTPYTLAKKVEQYVSPNSIYQFMREETGLRSDVASILLDALGLEITEK